MKVKIFAIMVFPLLLCSIGCFNSAIEKRKQLKNCDFMLKHVDVKEVGLTSMTLNLDIDVYNPNAIDVIVDKMEINVSVNDKFIGKGIHHDKITIKPEEEKTVSLDLHLEYIATYKAIKTLIEEKGDVDYKLKGKVYYSTIFGTLSFPFESKRKEKE